MTMLPDIDESAYDEWEKQQLAQRMEQKTSSFALEHALNSRISELTAFAAPSSSDSLTNPLGAGNAAPLPEPAAPEPAPPQPEESLPSPPPAPAPPTIAPPVQPAAPPAASTPQPTSSSDLGSWIETSAGAVGRAGGDVGLYLNNLRTSGDLVGNAIGAANKAGADLQSFASSLAPPPAPPQRTQAPSSSGGGAGGGVSVGSVPGWLSDMISRNAPPELANDPEFIRTVAAGAKTESGWDVNSVQHGFAMGSGKGARGLFQFDMGGMGAGIDEQALLGQQGAEMQASKIVPLYAKAYQSAPGNLSGAERASWVAAQAERPAGYTDPTSAARRGYASSFDAIGGAIGGAASAVGSAVQGAAQGLRQKAQDISQFGSGQLSSDEAYAACGPAAAVRFASMYGRNPTLREATDLASQVGWTSGSGMAGLSSEKALMDKLGVPTKMIAGAQWDQFAKEAQSGNPVTISTPGHYYFADGFDPTSGAFHVGRSGTDLKGGSEWMTPAQMETRMGKVQGGLLADNPQVPAPSIADRDSDPVSYLGRMKDTMGASITSGAPAPDLTDINGRLTSAATGTTYKAPLDLASGDLQAASVGEPAAITAPAETSPVDKLKSAFGDFIDSLGGGAKSATDALGGAAGNLVAAPGGGLPAASQPMPSDSLTNPLGAPREPTPDWVTNVGSAIAENQANPPLAGVREQIANAPVLGGALGMARGPMLLSDEEVLASPEADTARAILEQAARSSRAANPIVTDRDVAEAARGLMTGQAVAMTGEGFGNPRVRPDRMAPRSTDPGAVPASGENMLSDALGRLGRYPPEMADRMREWALGEDAPASTIATTLRRWMEENPAAVTESVNPAAVENIIEDLATEVRSGRGSIGSPSAEMPGQLSLGEGFMRERPLLPEGVENAETGVSPFESTQAAVERGRAQRAAQEAEVSRARAESRARGEPEGDLGQVDLPGFNSPKLKLPVFVGQGVSDLLERGNQAVSHTLPIDDGLLQGLADKAGESVERIRKVWKSSPENDAVLRSANRALDDSVRELADAQAKLKLDPNNDQSVAEVVRLLTRHQAVQEVVGARRPNAGSVLDQMTTTRAGRRAAEDQLTQMAKRAHMGDDVEGYVRELSKVDMTDPDVVASLAKVARTFTFADKATALWYFNLLSSPLTHIRNVTGNALTAATMPLESLGAAGFDPLARKLLGDSGPRQRYAGEAGAQLFGMGSSAMDAGRAGLQALKYGVPTKAGEFGRMSHEPFAGGPGEFLGYPGRMLEAEDQFFRGINTGAALRSEAYRVASQEGLTGNAFKERVAKLVKTPDDEMLARAQQQAEYRVFQQSGAAASALNNLADKVPAAKLLMPFVRTPVNVMKYTLERSPLGAAGILKDAVTPSGRRALQARGAGDLADRMSRTAMGSTVMGSAFAAAMFGNNGEGTITGRAPTDPVERDKWDRQGKTPYSFLNPVDGKWVSYAALQPYVPLLGSAADVAQGLRSGQIKNRDDVGAIATTAGFAAAQGLLNTQWTQGMYDVLDLMNGGSQDPGKDMARLATQYATNAIPGAGLWRSVARATDNVVRDPNVDFTPEGIGRGVAANLPGLSQTVRPKLDAFGYPITRPVGGLEAMINPVPGSAVPEDAVETELNRLQKATEGLPSNLGGYSVQPGFVGKDMTILKGLLPTELTDDQRQEYQQQSGYLSYAQLSALIGTKAWEAKSDAEKAKEVNRIYSTSREAVRKSMEAELLPQALGDFQRNLQRGIPAITPPRTTPGRQAEEAVAPDDEE